MSFPDETVLAPLLMSYRFDCPHENEDPKKSFYPDYTWDEFRQKFLEEEHCCKPTNLSGCPRCFGD